MKYNQILPTNNIHHCPEGHKLKTSSSYYSYKLHQHCIFQAQCNQNHQHDFNIKFNFYPNSGNIINTEMRFHKKQLLLQVWQDITWTRLIRIANEGYGVIHPPVAEVDQIINFDWNDIDQINKKIKLITTFS